MQNTHMLFHSVHQLSRELSKHLNDALEPFGLYSSQWAVLFVLKQEGTLTQKELCEYLAVEAPPMTRTIQRLSRQGLVEQHQGADKRKKYIMLTEKAIGKFPEWEAVVMEANHTLLKSFGSQSQEELQALLTEWLGMIKQESRGKGRGKQQ
ncbi:MarR family transcriptional regulator [Mesobacillus campisalis]|uniref:MarR family transcriptional regulator n=1 Tax=Mesobacillus campisalis TaxID=1408103 RepID=A0A0M2SPR7_9BACI|nr:MarR family transcriptional regulator [Mesobacillus campisalis]KKK36544.1 MarR family transcriptional regulator [Mesobacillus campisalis]